MTDPDDEARDQDQDDTTETADDLEYDEVHDGGPEPTVPGQGGTIEPPD